MHRPASEWRCRSCNVASSVADFNYSDGMKAHGGRRSGLDPRGAGSTFLTNPKTVVEGHQDGLCRPAQGRGPREPDQAYLETLGG
jgi:hypothetical protein